MQKQKYIKIKNKRDSIMVCDCDKINSRLKYLFYREIKFPIELLIIIIEYLDHHHHLHDYTKYDVNGYRFCKLCGIADCVIIIDEYCV
jgi:hypothetical protein